MKFAICQELFEGWDWKRQCEYAAKVGYAGLELAPFTVAERVEKISPAKRTELRKIASDSGVEIIGLHWLLAKTTGLHLTTFDAEVRKSTAAYLRELAKACGDLGGSVLVFGSPAQRSLERGMSLDQAYTNAAEVFKAAMPAFADANVKLCVEPLTPLETDFLNTCADGVKLIEMVDHPNIVLHQDVKAMLSEPTPIPDLIHKYRDITGHFHVNDSNLLGPGMGETDYHPILRALIDSDYSGWVSVEVFDYRPGAEVIAESSLSYMRQVLADLETAGA